MIITKELGKRLSMLLLVIISFLLMIWFYKSAPNLAINPKDYQIFHVLIETVVNITAASIFLLLHYTYPYENKLKYIVSGSLFLSIVIANTMHVYYSFINDYVMRTLTSNIVHLVMGLTFFLFVIIPDRPLKKNRWVISVLPAIVIAVNLILINLYNSGYVYFFVPSRFNSLRGTYYELLLSIIYFYSLLKLVKEYRINKSEIYSNLIKGAIFLIYAWALGIFIKAPTDLISASSQFFKLIGVVFTFKAYFVNNIKRPYESLQEASNIKTDFIVNLSHELRTPVNVILNALKILEQREQSSPYIKSIEKNAHRLNKVCENIILFNQIENDCTDIKLTDTDVVFLIDEILEEADGIADEKGLELNFEFESNQIIKTDSEKLRIILLNLISNSIKYVPVDGIVDIQLRISDKLEILILNNGPLIHENEKDKIFEKFYKSNDKNLCSLEGLGIGLYISKAYAELLDGSIETITRNSFTGYKLILPAYKSQSQTSKITMHKVKGYFADIS